MGFTSLSQYSPVSLLPRKSILGAPVPLMVSNMVVAQFRMLVSSFLSRSGLISLVRESMPSLGGASFVPLVLSPPFVPPPDWYFCLKSSSSPVVLGRSMAEVLISPLTRATAMLYSIRFWTKGSNIATSSISKTGGRQAWISSIFSTLAIPIELPRWAGFRIQGNEILPMAFLMVVSSMWNPDSGFSRTAKGSWGMPALCRTRLVATLSIRIPVAVWRRPV